MTKNQKRDFDRYIANQEPLPWTIVKDHPNTRFIGNEAMAMNYVRLKFIMDTVMEYFRDNWTIVDIGVYPGIIPKIFKEFFPGGKPYSYYGCGLGFDKNFREVMHDFKVTLEECDLDPRLNLKRDRPTRIGLKDNTADFCIFTDTIEHLFDPFHAAQEANRVSKAGGLLLMTTDNLTRMDSVLGVLKGKSCNIPLIEGNLFYEGDWRPHFREYSKGELCQLLEWAGFKIIKHKYFEAEFGLYRTNKKQLIKSSSCRDKKIIRNFIAIALKKLFPYFKDNQIILAQKIVPYQDMLNRAPRLLNNLPEWISQRKQFS